MTDTAYFLINQSRVHGSVVKPSYLLCRRDNGVPVGHFSWVKYEGFKFWPRSVARRPSRTLRPTLKIALVKCPFKVGGVTGATAMIKEMRKAQRDRPTLKTGL